MRKFQLKIFLVVNYKVLWLILKRSFLVCTNVCVMVLGKYVSVDAGMLEWLQMYLT